LVAGIALAVCCYWREKPAAQFETRPEPPLMSLEDKLNTIIIPDYPAAGITLEEAVEILRVKSRASLHSPSRMGVNIVIIAGDSPTLPASSSLKLRDVPLGEALRHITRLVGLKCTVERYAVAIREVNDPRVPVYQTTTGLQERMEKRILPIVSFQGATLEEAVEYLRVSRGCLDGDEISQEQRMAPPLNYVLHLREGGQTLRDLHRSSGHTAG
jgi:hypothetical protein